MSEPRRAAGSDFPVFDPEERVYDTTPRHGGRHPFTKAIGATVASFFVPGLGLVTAAPRPAKIVGIVSTSLFLGGLGYLGYRLLTGARSLAAWSVQTDVLFTLTVGLLVVALLWVGLIAGTHLVRRPREITRTQRIVGALTVGFLSFAISAPLAVAARFTYSQANLVNKVFASDSAQSQTRPTLEGTSVEDIWAKKPRLNLLLLGGDTTATRLKENKNRSTLTDTIMVASIDTKTGETVIIQIPRNMARTPFPPGSKLQKSYPNGFYDGRNPDNPEFFANAIWNNVPQANRAAIGTTDYPGADALKLGIGQAVGLQLDYFVLLNIDGLQNLIDAMGGVTVNINERLPIAGSSENPKATTGWLQPGPNQHLDGYNAMWYARSRWSTDDFNRMQRQSCLVNAIIHQADPMTMLTRYEAIAEASSKMVETDMPQSALPAIVDLALRVKRGTIKRVIFQHQINGYNTLNPDFTMMRERVREALIPTPEVTTPETSPSGINTTEAQPAAPAPATTPTSGASSKVSPTPSAIPTTDTNVNDTCGYHPKKP